MTKEAVLCMAVAFALMTIFTVGGTIRGNMVEKRYRSEAVERGYAEWVVDSSGHAEWRWVEGK